MIIEIKGQKVFIDEILAIKCAKKDKFPIKIIYEGNEYFIQQGTKNGGLFMNMHLLTKKTQLNY